MTEIIFKATEACNCRCAYCDVVERRAPRTISPEMMRLAMKRIIDHLAADPEERVHIVWHGGEPLMAGLDIYQLALDCLDSAGSEIAGRVTHSVQTNLTMLTSEAIGLFKRMGVSTVGTSYDFTPGVRGIGAGRDTRAYNRRLLDAVNLLEESGLQWGFIYVVTRAVIDRPDDTLHHLLNLSPRGRIMFNPVLVYDGAPAAARATTVTAREYADFLGRVFRLWYPRRRFLDGMQPFTSLIHTVVDGVDELYCNESVDCGGLLYIGPDGSLSQCGRASDWGLVDYGNIAAQSIADCLAHPVRRRLDERHRRLRAGDCKDCRLWSICHGGCPLDASGAGREAIFTRRSSQCEWFRTFITEHFEPVTGVTITSDEQP